MPKITIVIDKSEQETENKWFRENIDPHGDTYTVPVRVDPKNEDSAITGYIMSGEFSEEQAAKIMSHRKVTDTEQKKFYTDFTTAKVITPVKIAAEVIEK